MRKLALAVILISLAALVSASTVESDGSVPDNVLRIISLAIDESTKGRGDLHFVLSGYTDSKTVFPGQHFASFLLSYGGKEVRVSAKGEHQQDLEQSLESEIGNLLYYEELLLAPSPRLDYITGYSYSFLPDKRYRKGTRLKAVDRDGRTRALFEVSGTFGQADTLDPLYLSKPYPGIALRKTGEWTLEASGGYGVKIDKHRWFVKGSLSRSDLLYPFSPVVSFVYNEDEYAAGIYGAFGLKASLHLRKAFPGAGFTLVQEGRIGAEAALLFGVYDDERTWDASFSIYYEHQILPRFSWRAGYERLGGLNYLFASIGGNF